MPADPTSKSRKRSLTPRRGAIACVRCKERKAKCAPAPPGSSKLPTCMNCLNARASCVYVDRTPNEIFLLEYVSQLEARVATLEMELSKYNPSSSFTEDHSNSQQAMTAAVHVLTQEYGNEESPQRDGSVRRDSGGPSEVEKKAPTEHEDDELAVGVGMLSLSGLGDPLYLGASSGVKWANVCAAALRRPDTLPVSQGRFAFQAPPYSASAESALSYGIENPIPPLPPQHLADQYFDMVYNHVQAQYAFLDWHALRNWHARREEICLTRPIVGSGQGSDHARGLAAFILWLVYGYGARLTEERKTEGALSHEFYYSAAVSCLSTLTSHHSLATVQCLLLLETYSIWHARSEISTWQVAGLAMRTAVELGLHRRTRSRSEREKDPLRYEMKKRVFWSVYTMDRMIALQLGRPSGIADTDIDIEFPLNIDLEVTDPKHIFEMQNRQIEITKDKGPGEEYAKGYDQVNSMTSSIHNIRLNQLKQQIHNVIYRLDKPQRDEGTTNGANGPQPIPEVEEILRKLNEWRACRPLQPPNTKPLPLLSEEQLGLDYHECVQMMLRPITNNHKAASLYAPLCADSAACCCETDVFAPNSPSLRLVTWQLYRLFLSALTLLHLISSSSAQSCIDHDRATRALYAALQTIGHLVQRVPGVASYETILGELIKGWETRRHAPISQIPVTHHPELARHATTSASHSQAMRASQTATPGLNNQQSMASGMNWNAAVPANQPGPVNAEWMTALLDNGNFGQNGLSHAASHYPMSNDQASGSGSGSGSVSGSGQYGYHNGQQTLSEDMGNSWTPLFGSPRSTEAFSDQWGGALIQMGGQVAGPVRDDFFDLISSFGLETIAESANETTFSMADSSGWPAPGLDSLILGTAQPTAHQQAGSNIPDLTAMGMGEFLEWSQRTGRTGQYEAYQMGSDGHGRGDAFGHTQSQGNGEEERRGRQY